MVPSPSVMIFLALAASWQFDLGLVSALGVATPLNNWRCGIISISTARRRRPRHRWLDDDYDDDGVLDLRFYSVSRRPTTRILNMSKRTPSREVGSPASSPERDENGMETTKTTTTPVRGRYFDFDSTVRSTTRTGAVDRTMQSTTMTTNEVAPDVMRPFTLLLLSQFVLFVGVGAVIPTIPLYGQSIGLSSASNGIVIGAPALALLLVNRAAGGYADDGGRKRAMMGGMAIIALADLGTAYSSDLASLVAARLGLGLGRGYAEAGERGMLADLASAVPGLRGRALALQQACVALGIAIGAPLGGIVVQEYGPRSAFLCVSAAAVAVLAIYAVLPETRVRDDDDGKGAEAGNVNGDGGELWRRLLMTSSTWRSLALAQSGASFGFACKIAIVPILADDYLGGPAGAGLLLSAAGLAGLVGAPLGGLLADRAGSRIAAAVSGTVGGLSLGFVPIGLSLTKLMGSPMTLTDGGDGPLSSPLVVDGLYSVPSWIGPTLDELGSPEAVAFVVLVLLWSMGASAQGPALMALAQEKSPVGSEATALGLPRAIGDGTYIVAPLIMGYFCDIMGDAVPGIACTIAGGAIVLGSIALLSFDQSDDDA